MNDLSSRVESHRGSTDAHASTRAAQSTGELLRRAESVRTMLVFAGVMLVIALTVVVQSNAARRSAERSPGHAAGQAAGQAVGQSVGKATGKSIGQRAADATLGASR